MGSHYRSYIVPELSVLLENKFPLSEALPVYFCLVTIIDNYLIEQSQWQCSYPFTLCLYEFEYLQVHVNTYAKYIKRIDHKKNNIINMGGAHSNAALSTFDKVDCTDPHHFSNKEGLL